MRKYHTINYSILGARVAKRRNQLNMSQKQVAELLDCNESYISKLETGKAHVSLDLLYLLAKLLDVGMDYFFPDTVCGVNIIKDELQSKWDNFSPEALRLVDKIAVEILDFEKEIHSKNNSN
jgi:transcriptional regulator with XRE-family HTH domain